MEAERGSPVNKASSPTVSPRPISPPGAEPRHHVDGEIIEHATVDGVLAAQRGIAIEILARLGGTIKDFADGTINVFGSLSSGSTADKIVNTSFAEKCVSAYVPWRPQPPPN